MVTVTKEFTYAYSQSDRQLDDVFDGGNTVPHEKKIYSQKKTTSNVKNYGNFGKRTSELHERAKQIAVSFVLEKNVGKALISIEDLKQS